MMPKVEEIWKKYQFPSYLQTVYVIIAMLTQSEGIDYDNNNCFIEAEN